MREVWALFLLILCLAEGAMAARASSLSGQCARDRFSAYLEDRIQDYKFKCYLENDALDRKGLSGRNLVDREVAAPPKNKQTMVGISLSGGGSRSLALSRGELAVLFNRLGLENKVNYISMISGGGWAGGNYYILKNPEDRKNYLGTVVDDISTLYLGYQEDEHPNNIAWLHNKSLGKVPQAMGFWDVVSFFTKNMLFSGNQLWQYYLKDRLMEPYGINASAPFSEKLFAAKPRHMQLIFTAAIKNSSGDLVPFEMTPVAIRSRKVVDDKGESYMAPPESFGQNIIGLEGGYLQVEKGKKFSLGDVYATTSANYVHLFPQFWNFISSYAGMAVPTFKLASLDFSAQKVLSKEYPIVDIGPIEYLGVIPLVARNIPKVIAFVNTDIPIKKGNSVIGMEKFLTSYFGIVPDELAEGKEYVKTANNTTDDCGEICRINQIFPASRYRELAEGLWGKKCAGLPLTYLQKKVPVYKNAFYGVEGGYDVDILWVYNDVPDGWVDRLAPELQALLAQYPHFPHFNTVTELYINAEMVNLLFHLAAWSLLNSKTELNYIFSDEAAVQLQ